MNLTWTPELRRFREEVAAFAAASLPPDIRDKVLRHQRLERDDYVRWHLVLADRGWGAPTWPVEHGGTGWNALQRLIFEVECFKAGAPRLLPFGLSMIGPVLMKYGSAAQQAELLPRIIRVQDWWCQGYSEPGSGSDLASLSTRAERDGGEYVVNGQKTWTTLAQYADRMFCLVRTDHGARAQRHFHAAAGHASARRQRASDPDAGRWLRRQRSLAGKRARAGRQPGGEENQGWTYAKYLLGHERTGIAGLGHCHRELGILKRMAWQATSRGRPLLEDSRMRDRISRIEADIMALEMLLLRVAAGDGGAPAPGVGAEDTRLRNPAGPGHAADGGGRPGLLALRPGLDAGGRGLARAGAGDGGCRRRGYADMRKTSIYGGTTEVQKGIIARHALGL